MGLFTGIIIILIGIFVFNTGSHYLCPHCSGWSFFNPMCHAKSASCSFLVTYILGIGIILAGVVAIFRK